MVLSRRQQKSSGSDKRRDAKKSVRGVPSSMPDNAFNMSRPDHTTTHRIRVSPIRGELCQVPVRPWDFLTISKTDPFLTRRWTLCRKLHTYFGTRFPRQKLIPYLRIVPAASETSEAADSVSQKTNLFSDVPRILRTHSGVGRGVPPRPQPQTGRASFQASGFPDIS